MILFFMQSINNQKKFGNRGGSSGPSSAGYGTGRKVLGVTRFVIMMMMISSTCNCIFQYQNTLIMYNMVYTWYLCTLNCLNYNFRMKQLNCQ